ncbi:MAG: protein-disulfide reductase DsbD domain-containing protein [Verrucomicrobiota bacterium]
MHRLSVSCLALATLLQSAGARIEPAGVAPATRAEWVAEVLAVAPGATFTVALQLALPAGWHGYYQNSGGVEQAPALTWQLPAGFSAGPIQWPVPEVIDGFFGKSFVYTGSPVFLIDLTAPATLATGTTLTLSAEATWQICENRCLNEHQTLTLNLPVGPAVVINPALAQRFAAARARQPARPANWRYAALSDGGDIILRVEPAGQLDHAPTDFIPNQPFIKAASDGGSIRREGNAWRIQLARATRDALDHPVPQGASMSGILAGPRPVAVPETAIAAPPAQALPLGGYLKLLAAMMLGGLILNLMPCVFPVIGLKILGFVQQAGADRKKIAGHGLSFTLGVLVSFGALSGMLFAARAAVGGSDLIGWGYQLQNPWVILGLMVLMFVLALNLFGVFEMGTSATSLGGALQSRQGFAGSFFSGALATVVATPCSGPLLGVALGAAVSLPALQFFAAFAAMAAGLALPYLVLSVWPRLLGLLPRPGPWMESFKQAMSFPLFATAGYLLWVYAGQIGLDNLLGPVFGLSSIAVAGWIYGRWHLPHRSRATRLGARLLSIAMAAGGLWLAKPPPPSALTWEPWSAERVATLLDHGTPVYIDFTAQWCATCQFNKKRAYTPEVVALMKAKRVVALKADKTTAHPEIETALRQLGRTAIPVNVLLAPGKEPEILPELLAPRDLLEALRRL